MSDKNFKNWFSDAELVYSQALMEYQNLQEQIETMEKQLAAKRAEINQVALVLGKAPIEAAGKLSAHLIDAPAAPQSTIAATITRALNGRSLGRG